MKIILATNNKNKVKEIKFFLKDYEIFAIDEILEPFEIVENGKSFKENALIKANAVFEKLNEKQKNEFVVLSDDSGISVEALDFRPGIFSARFNKQNPTDAKNREKLISELKNKNLEQSKAFYTAAIAIKSKFGEYSTHGFMHGIVTTKERGSNGFGYDFLFIPNGFSKTISELNFEEKNAISHRTKALNLAKIALRILNRKFQN